MLVFLGLVVLFFFITFCLCITTCCTTHRHRPDHIPLHIHHRRAQGVVKQHTVDLERTQSVADVRCVHCLGCREKHPHTIMDTLSAALHHPLAHPRAHPVEPTDDVSHGLSDDCCEVVWALLLLLWVLWMLLLGFESQPLHHLFHHPICTHPTCDHRTPTQLKAGEEMQKSTVHGMLWCACLEKRLPPSHCQHHSMTKQPLCKVQPRIDVQDVARGGTCGAHRGGGGEGCGGWWKKGCR